MALALAACAGGSSRATSTPGHGAAAPTTLGALVSFRGPKETIYKWISDDPEHDVGVMIWRIDATGTLQRWDAVTTGNPNPTTGQFEVLNDANDMGLAYWCEWSVSSSNRSQVHTDCEDALNLASLMTLTIASLPILGNTAMTPHGERTILKRSIPCWTGGQIDQICLDSNGYVMYFSVKHQFSTEVLEATSVLPAAEPFDWPAAASATPGPIPTVESAESLDMPQAFHLNND